MILQSYAIYNKNSEQYGTLQLFHTDKEASYCLSRDFVKSNPPEALNEYSLVRCGTFDTSTCELRGVALSVVPWDSRIIKPYADPEQDSVIY